MRVALAGVSTRSLIFGFTSICLLSQLGGAALLNVIHKTEASEAFSIGRPSDVNAALPSTDSPEDGPSGPVYTLASGDRLSIQFYQRADLSGEVRVRTDGTVAVPLLGTFRAQGRSPNELERSLAQAFERMTNRPSNLVLDVLEWRPIIVAGAVEKPGAVVFKSGLTALQVLALAGGIHRPAASSTAALDVSRESWQMRQTTERLKYGIARLARFLAERNGQTKIEVPTQLMTVADEQEASALISAEQRILQQRADAFDRQMRAADRAAELSRDEIQELREEVRQVEEQIRLYNSELADAQTLANRGLIRSPRLAELRRSTASLEAERRRVNANIARAEQAAANVERDRTQVVVDRSLKLEEELKVTENEVRGLELTLRGSEDTLRHLTGLHVSGRQAAEPRVHYTVMRRVGDSQQLLPVDETFELQPGDTLRISLPALRQ